MSSQHCECQLRELQVQVSIVNVSYANFKYKSGQVSNVIVSYANYKYKSAL